MTVSSKRRDLSVALLRERTDQLSRDISHLESSWRRAGCPEFPGRTVQFLWAAGAIPVLTVFMFQRREHIQPSALNPQARPGFCETTYYAYGLSPIASPGCLLFLDFVREEGRENDPLILLDQPDDVPIPWLMEMITNQYSDGGSLYAIDRLVAQCERLILLHRSPTPRRAKAKDDEEGIKCPYCGYEGNKERFCGMCGESW